MGIPRLTPRPLRPREASPVETPPRRTQPASEPAGVRVRVGSRLADELFRYAMIACGLSVAVVLGLILYELVANSTLSLHQFGWEFFSSRTWDPANDVFGAAPFIYGTIISSVIALVIAVPLGLGVAVFITEMCPRGLRGILSFSTELLAAIPSVIYGLWAIFVLVPILRLYIKPGLMRYLGWTGLFEGPPYGIGMLAAGIVLAVMVIPIISSLTREVLSAVPRHQREAALALGATRWEMIRVGVLRNARAGILGAVILGLGRAFGETMAVTMVIGNRPEIAKSLLAPGYTLAGSVANEFAEAVSNMHLSALMESALVLFAITLVVNALAGLLVWSITRGTAARAIA